MNVNYVKKDEDQALLDEAYNEFVNSSVNALQIFVKDLLWKKLQDEEDPDEMAGLAVMAKTEIDKITFNKVAAALYITRTSNSDALSHSIHEKIVAPIFVKLGLGLKDIYIEKFDLSCNKDTCDNWIKLSCVMTELYKKFLTEEQFEKEKRIASNKKIFDSIFENGDE